MKKIMRLIIAVLFFIPIHIKGKDTLLPDGINDEKEAYQILMRYNGTEILEEYIALTHTGSSNLIPYACALYDKKNEFSETELVDLILRIDTLGEVESVLAEMLMEKDIDFDDLLYLQQKDIDINTKMLLLQSDSIDITHLKEYTYLGEDFRSRTAMQQLSFRDDKMALDIALDLLRMNSISYYQLSAVNVALDQYYRYHPDDDTLKQEVIDRLFYIYNNTEDEQEHFWIMESLGWCQDWNLFTSMIDNENIDPYDRYVYFLSSEYLVEKYSSLKGISDEVKYYLEKYNHLLTDEVIENTLSINALSSYKGYAVYRNGVPFSSSPFNHHAALMYKNKITGGSSYSSYSSTAQDVIHAPGPSSTVNKASWSNFLNSNTFVAACRPYTCGMTSTNTLQFTTKASALIGTSYTVLYQIDYTIINDGSTIEPSQITNMRCDGVVEYVYEYYGYKVGGGSTTWNISKNYTVNHQAHSGVNITPQTQNSSLLYRVTTTQSDLY